jgi:hypothetical protein
LTLPIGIETGQESGVTGNSKPFFGPATKEYYDNANWALVPATQSVEYIPDASLFSSSRDPDIPAFIKPIPSPDFLPALLTILHTIPLFRNALLTPQVRSENYWRGEDWWKGSAAASARILDNGSSVEAAGLEIIHEIQRLMAFLDQTDRAYASLDSLLQLEAWKEFPPSPEEPSDDDILKFLLRWSALYHHYTPDVRLDGCLRSSININGTRQTSFVLDVTVTHQDKATARNLYDILDDTLFVSATRNAHIMDISDVLILRLSSSKDGEMLDCKVPATLYADRYLEANRALIDGMFAEMNQYKEQLAKIDLDIHDLKWHKPKKCAYLGLMDSLVLIKNSMVAFQMEDPEDFPHHPAILDQLQGLYDKIERGISGMTSTYYRFLKVSSNIPRSRGRKEEN